VKVSTDRLSLYATVFHNEFRGLATTQIVGGVPVAATGGAHTTGVELEGAIRPVTGISIAFSGTYLDAKYKNFFDNGGTINDSGNRVERQPKWQWRVTPSYTEHVTGGSGTVFATISYIGDRFSDPENLQVLPNYYKVDAGLSFDVTPGFKLLVTGDNLTNAIGLTEGNVHIIGAQGGTSILARPILGRSYRFSVQVGF
jgi:iron complex outermembrane receptor protein